MTYAERSLILLARGLALPHMRDGSLSTRTGKRARKITAREVLEGGILAAADYVAEEHELHQRLADRLAEVAAR